MNVPAVTVAAWKSLSTSRQASKRTRVSRPNRKLVRFIEHSRKQTSTIRGSAKIAPVSLAFSICTRSSEHRCELTFARSQPVSIPSRSPRRPVPRH